MIPRLIFICTLALLSFAFKGGKEKTYPFDKWRQTQLDSANTAKDSDVLTDEEKSVVFLTNLARMNPKLFGETYAQKFIDSTENKSGYARSLLNDLKRGIPLCALEVDTILCSTAADHATLSGKTGRTGHGGKQARIKKAMVIYNAWGENCSYGFNNGIGIVMQLLIDQGIKDLGHRKNILNKQFTHIGTAIRPHRKYKWNCVQDFGGVVSR